jgi:Rhs element Vgr protein
MANDLLTDTSLRDVVTFDISIDGKAIDAGLQILSLVISKELNRIPVAKLIIRDGDAAMANFEVSSANYFVPGKPILIKIGRDGTNTQAFAGIVTKHAIRIKENGSGELHIECRDQAVRMSIGRHNGYFEKMKDNQLFDQLIGKYKQYDLKSDPGKTTLEHKQIVQHNISDWDFMLLRAEANGMLVNTDDGTISIAIPNTDQKPVAQVTYGSSLLEFDAEMDARTQWKSVTANAWDYTNQKLFSADASSVSFSEPGNISGSDLADSLNNGLGKYELHHSGYLLEQELKDWTSGMIMRSRLAKISGRAKIAGTAGIKPGNIVAVKGVGDRFSGNAFITAVKHEIGHGEWDTHIQFGLNPKRYGEIHNEDLNDLQAAGLTGAIHGLQIGKVVQLENDPDGENRILVKTPTLDNNAKGIWTRVASLDAGSDRGAFFMPEIDDEVVVGFINDDPRHAVMLGMLHSSAKAAPITAQDANNEKGFTTRSKMHVSFDDQNKKITIDTPAGNSITLDEQGMQIVIKDQSDNKITMSTSGISIESSKNIDIKAGVNLTLSAGASLSVKGVSVSVKADADVGVEGSMAKLAGQGMTQITGGLVTIN